MFDGSQNERNVAVPQGAPGAARLGLRRAVGIVISIISIILPKGSG